MTTGPGDGEQWLADYMRRVGDIQERAEQTQEQIRNLRAYAANPENTVSVELAPGGRLAELKISQNAMELGPHKLAAVIKQTVQSAHADAAERTQQALQPLVGESDAMEFLRDHLGVSDGQASDTEVPADDQGGDDSFGGVFRR